eukprot:scaffold4103_cov248-Ochromonas_danica.AAC.2
MLRGLFSQRTNSKNNPERSLGHNEDIDYLFADIDRAFENLAILPIADRLCEETLNMCSSLEPKLRLLVDMIANDDSKWKKERIVADAHFDSVAKPCIVDSIMMYTLCNRAVQDIPRGSMPILMNTLTAILDCSSYPLLLTATIVNPIKQLINVAMRYEEIFDNCFEEDAVVYSNYLRRIALFMLVQKQSTFHFAHQALLVACNTQDPNMLGYFSSRHDYVRHWILNLQSSFFEAFEVMKEHADILSEVPDYLQVFLSSSTSAIPLRKVSFDKEKVNKEEQAFFKQIVIEKVHRYLRILTLIASVHGTLLRSAKQPILPMRTGKGSKARAKWIALSHISHDFFWEFLHPVLNKMLDVAEEQDLVAGYIMLSLSLNTLYCSGNSASSKHVLVEEENDDVSWSESEQSLLSLTVKHILKSILVDLAWGRVGSLCKPTAMAAIAFLSTLLKATPPLAGLHLLYGPLKEGQQAAGRNVLFRALTQSKPLLSVFQGSFTANVNILYDASIRNLRRQSLFVEHQPVPLTIKEYAAAMSHEVVVLLLSDCDGLLNMTVGFFDRYRHIRFRSHHMDVSHHRLLSTSGDCSFFDRLFRKFLTFDNLLVQEQIALSALFQESLVLVAVLMILGSEVVAKQHLAVLEEVLKELQKVRSVILSKIPVIDEKKHKAAVEAVHSYMQKEGMLFVGKDDASSLCEETKENAKPCNTSPPAQRRSSLSKFFGLFSSSSPSIDSNLERDSSIVSVDGHTRVDRKTPTRTRTESLQAYEACGDEKDIIRSLVILDEVYLEALSCLVAVQKLRTIFHSHSILRCAMLPTLKPQLSSESYDCVDSLEEPAAVVKDLIPLCELVRMRNDEKRNSFTHSQPFSWDNAEEVFEEEFVRELMNFHTYTELGHRENLD